MGAWEDAELARARGYVVTSVVRLASWGVLVSVTLLDGRKLRATVAPDEYVLHGEARVIPVLAAMPVPPRVAF